MSASNEVDSGQQGALMVKHREDAPPYVACEQQAICCRVLFREAAVMPHPHTFRLYTCWRAD